MKKKLKGLLAIWIAALLLLPSMVMAVCASDTYTVTFYANGGRGTMAPQENTVGEPANLSKNTFTRRGYTFAGWSGMIGSGSVFYTDQEEVTLYEDIELFAKWEKHSGSASATVVYHDCTSICSVCGGCEDLDCNYPKCWDKCRLLTMRFSDVKEDAWYTESVGYVYHHGIMEGVSKTRFGVSEFVKRAMIVTMLWRLEGEPAVDYAMKFADVGADAYYTEAVRWAASEGIVVGYTETEFMPETDITREQMAAIIYRYAQYKNVAPAGAWAIRMDYPDLAAVADYAAEPVMYCTLKKLMQGREGGVFAPQEAATRAEIGVVFHRFMEAE